MLKRALILLSLFVILNPIFAEKFHIQSKKLKIQNDKAIYIGNVIATTKNGKSLKCDKLILFLNKTGEIKKIKAIGHVLFQGKELKAAGNIAIYNPIKKEIILEGNALVVKNNTIVKGEKIIYNLLTGVIDVKSHERINSVINIDKPNNGK